MKMLAGFSLVAVLVCSAGARAEDVGKAGVYTVKQKGHTGWAKFTHDNVYKFTITNTCNQAVVLVEAFKPKRYSRGEVRLKFDDQKVVIGGWTQKGFR